MHPGIRYKRAMTTFAESLDSLWAVQKHDKQIVKARRDIEKAERDKQAAAGKTKAAEDSLIASKENLRKLQNQHKELEAELKRLDERIKKLESLGTEDGNAAAARQREAVDVLEIQGLDLIASVSKAEMDVQAAEATLHAQKQVQDGTFRAADGLIEAAENLARVTGEARDLAAAGVVPELLAVYDEVNTRHPGNAICHIEREFCAGCQGELNTQLCMQIRARREILRCPHCARILDV